MRQRYSLTTPLFVPSVLVALMAASLTQLAPTAYGALVRHMLLPVTASSHTVVNVLTYTSGGPRHATGVHMVSDATVRVRKSSGTGTGTPVGVKRTTNGHAAFVVRPDVYRIEAAIEPPESRPRTQCGPPKTVRLTGGKSVTVKFYCSIP
jgi:hypothetical protein